MCDFVILIPYLRAKDRLRCEQVCRLWWASSRCFSITSELFVAHYQDKKGDKKSVALITDDLWVDFSEEFPFSIPFLVQQSSIFVDNENFHGTSPKLLELIGKILKRIGPALKTVKFLEKIALVAEPLGYGGGKAPRALIYEDLLKSFVSQCPNLRSMHFGNVKFMQGALL